MPPRKKGAVRAATARAQTAKGAAPPESHVHVARHNQVIRNAYIIAQSHLLQLAKQMEFDADLSPWETEVDEKMSEFWQQTHENVDQFYTRVRYVSRSRSASRDAMPKLVADVVKSPRKRAGEITTPASPPAVRSSPKLPAHPRAFTERADVSHSDDEFMGNDVPAAQSQAAQDDRLLAPSTGGVEDTQPEREEALNADPAPSKSAHFAKSPERVLPLPSTTPGTGLRTKRALSSAVVRSTKKPAEPAPPAQPSSRTPAPRFRSSFLNKSLYKAIEERQGSNGLDADDSGLEPSPFDDSHDGLTRSTQSGPAHENDTTDTNGDVPASPPRAPHTGAGALDALRTRLESVRRTSAAHNTHTVPSMPTAQPVRPADASYTSTVRATEDTKSVPEEPERSTTPKHATPPSRGVTPCRPGTTPSRIPLALRSPARGDRPGSRVDRPLSRADAARPVSRVPERPMSRADVFRSPSRTAVPRSPSRAGGAPLARTERAAASPARLERVAPSPFHVRESKTPAPTFPREPSQELPSPHRAPMRSPGRLREDRLSPFRATNPTSAPHKGSPELSRSVPTHAVPPARPASPKLARPASPQPAAPSSPVERDAPQPGLGARIRGMLGFSGLQAKARSPSPKLARPGSAMASTSPTGVPRTVSPKRDVHTALGIHDDVDELDERQVRAAVGMPGAFQEPSLSKETVRPVQRKVLAPARPAPRLAPGTRPSSQARPASAASVRPPRAPVVPVRLSQARPSPALSRVSTSQTYTYEAESKRRKVSQQPLQESTNHDERVSSESALKSKLTTSTGPTQPVRLSKVSHTTARPPVRPPSSVSRAWPKPNGAPRSSAMSATNVFQQQPAAPDPGNVSMEDLPDVQSEYSDSEDEASMKKRKLEPSWTRGRELEDLLLQQSTVDPDEIFGFQLGPVPLDAMLPPRKGDRRRARNRTSSANWSGPDGLAQWEIDRYNERMGIRGAHAGNAV